MPRQARGGEQLCRAQHASVPSAPMSPLGVLPPRARPRAELRGHGQGMWAPGALPSGRPSAPAPGWSASSPGNRPVASGAEQHEVPRGLVHAGRKSSLDRGAASAHADPAAPDPDGSMAFHTHPRRCLGDPPPAPEARGSVFPLPSGVAEGRVPDGASFLSPRISAPVGQRGSPRTSWPPALSTSRPHPLG